MVRNTLAERREIARRIKSLRETLGIKTQAALAELLEMRQARVNAWENAKEPPTCEALARLGNLAPYPDCLWFWEACGIDINGAMLRAAGQLLRERGEMPPQGKTLAVPPGEGDGAPWYVDARIVPRPEAVAYVDLDTSAPGKTGLQNGRSVVVVDTAARFDAISHSLVLIESLERTAGLPRRGFLIGHFQTVFDPFDGSCVLEFTKLSMQYRYEPEGYGQLAPMPGKMGPHDPRGQAEVQRYYVSFQALWTPEECRLWPEGADAEKEELRNKVKEGRRNFPLPESIRFVGRVLAIMEVPEGKES